MNPARQKLRVSGFGLGFRGAAQMAGSELFATDLSSLEISGFGSSGVRVRGLGFTVFPV